MVEEIRVQVQEVAGPIADARRPWQTVQTHLPLEAVRDQFRHIDLFYGGREAEVRLKRRTAVGLVESIGMDQKGSYSQAVFSRSHHSTAAEDFA